MYQTSKYSFEILEERTGFCQLDICSQFANIFINLIYMAISKFVSFFFYLFGILCFEY